MMSRRKLVILQVCAEPDKFLHWSTHNEMALIARGVWRKACADDRKNSSAFRQVATRRVIEDWSCAIGCTKRRSLLCDRA